MIDDTAIPAMVLVGLALLVLVGMGGAGARVLRFQRAPEGPDRAANAVAWVPPEVSAEALPRDALIEAELQEMIAEAQADSGASDRDSPAPTTVA